MQFRASKCSSNGSLFMRCDLINSSKRSRRAQTRDLPWVEARSSPPFLCLMADLCSFTLNTRLGSCMIAAAYWSSVRQVRMMKHRVTLLCATSDLVSCIAMEMYSRKVTRRLTDLTSSGDCPLLGLLSIAELGSASDWY